MSIIILVISAWALDLVGQHYWAWLDCTDVQAGLAVYWWRSVITFGSSRIAVNINISENSLTNMIKTNEQRKANRLNDEIANLTFVHCCYFSVV